MSGEDKEAVTRSLPTVGRIVHFGKKYQAVASPTDEGTLVAVAATVTRVHEDGTLGLELHHPVFKTPWGGVSHHSVALDTVYGTEWDAPYSETLTEGHWTWPLRA